MGANLISDKLRNQQQYIIKAIVYDFDIIVNEGNEKT